MASFNDSDWHVKMGRLCVYPMGLWMRGMGQSITLGLPGISEQIQQIPLTLPILVQES